MKWPLHIITDPIPYDPAAHHARIKTLLRDYHLRPFDRLNNYVDTLLSDIPDQFKPAFRNFLITLLNDEDIYITLGDEPMAADEITYRIYTRLETFLNHWKE